MATQAIAFSEADIRLEDYLDDKLQSTTDLETANLLALLETVESQRNILQTQLDEATRALEVARLSSSDRQGVLLARIAEFEDLQHSIDSRRELVASSDAPDIAIQRLENPIAQLHRIELTHRYVALLADVDAWRGEALSHLPQSPKEALAPYSKIKKLASRMKELMGDADLAADHLVAYVDRVSDLLWDEMKATMLAEMDALLQARKWPQFDPAEDMDEEWLECFGKLVDLQVPEILYGDSSAVSLLAMDAMTKSFILEFKFHFMSDRPTSKPDALAACFRWFMSLITKWEEFLRANLSPLLAARFQDTTAETTLIYVDPVSAFITSMLPAMREKALSIAGLALDHPQFLSSLITDLTAFDEKIRRRFHYDGGDAENGWAGLASDVLDKHFATWFEAEKTFALDRFSGIMSSQEARSIDYEYGGQGKMKPTHGAVRIMDLLKTVTGQYRGIRQFSRKMKFIVDIQNAVLEEFDDRLKGSLEVYSSLTSTVGRTLHGVSKEQLAALEGTGAFESLCKVLGSSDHVVRSLEAWSMDEFFVGFWDDLQTRAQQLDSQGSCADGLSFASVKLVTSPSLGSDDEGATIFDAPIAGFGNNKNKAENLLVGALVESQKEAFKSYFTKPQWTTLSDDHAVDVSQIPITAELGEPLQVLERNLAYILKTVNTATFRRVWRQVLTKISNMLWTNVLFHHNFTTLGAAQLTRDVQAITSLIERYIPGKTDHLAQLKEGLVMLSLPLEAPEGGLGLGDAYGRVFTGNAEAREVLGELGLETLSPTNARNILQRRVEAGE